MLDIMASIGEDRVVGKARTISDEVRDAVNRSGRSRYSICKSVRIDQSAFSRFMSGKRGLSMEVLDRLGLLLDLHITTGKRGRKVKP